MLKLLLHREHGVTDATIGRLTLDGRFLCDTLEDRVREIPGRPVTEWKIHGQTAIPAGSYRITLEVSPRFGPDTLTVGAVPGFAGVRIHPGNTADDTEGCILLGLKATDHSLGGGTSRPAVQLVKGVVKAAIDRGEEVWLEILNP